MSTLQVHWRQAGSTITLSPRFDHSLNVVHNSSGSKIFAIGGHGVPVGDEIQQLDSSLSAWSKIVPYFSNGMESSRIQRGSHAAAVVGDSIFVFGGYGQDNTLGDLLEYDTRDSGLKAPVIAGEAPPPRSSASATSISHRIYLIGGHSDDGTSSDVHILDTKSREWVKPTILGTCPPARCAHTAEAIGQDRIAVFGGYGQKPLGDIWFLEVDTPYVREQRAKLGGEVVAWSPGVTVAAPKPVVICGPSGVGKGTLISKLMKEFPDKCGFSVSHTTRNPRSGEMDGVHYNFTTREIMSKEVQDGKFLESAAVHGNLYGTSIAAVQKVSDSGKMCILDIDVQGAEAVKKSSLPALFVFIAPPSIEELERRLRGRGTETEEQVEKRLKNAKLEMDRGKDSSLFDHVLINDNLENTYIKLRSLLDLGPEAAGAKEPMGPSARSGHASALLGAHLIIFGGSGENGVSYDDLCALDVSSLSGGFPGVTRGIRWSALEPSPPTLLSSFWQMIGFPPAKPGPRYNLSAVALSPSEALLAGGYESVSKQPLSDTLLLQVAERQAT